jgi:hypothetical protein
MRLAATLFGSVSAHVLVAAIVLHRWSSHPAPDPMRVVEIDPAPAIAGDTFDLPQDDPSGAPTTANGTDDQPSEDGTHVRRPRGAQSSSQSSSSSASSVLPSRYGAVGQRGSFELVPTFSRAFAQAASSDPAWATAPLGDAGSVDLTFTIDESGALVGTVVGGSGSQPLRHGIERTIALIAGRTFFANGAETRIRVSATIVPDAVHDGLHGEVFAIGASGSSAFFALAIGRRIDIDIAPR